MSCALLPFACGGSTDAPAGAAGSGGQSAGDGGVDASAGQGGATGGFAGMGGTAGGTVDASDGAAGAAGGSDLLDACTAYVEASCAKSACVPALAPLFGPTAECVPNGITWCIHAQTLPGSNLNATNLLGCAAKVESTSCDDFWYGGGTLFGAGFTGCPEPGDRPAGATCISAIQCASLACGVGSTGCGTCLPGLGDPCTFTCGGAALCQNDLCVSAKKLGESCATNEECGSGLTCSAGTCEKAGGVGASCGSDWCDAFQGAVCVAGTCAAFEFPSAGESCDTDTTLFCDHDSSCLITNTGATCQPRPGKGEACKSPGPHCQSPYSCVNGTCDVLDPSTCP